MTSRVIKTEFDRKLAMRLLEGKSLPFTINITEGEKRSVEQNRLQRLWVKEIAEQLGGTTAEEVRGYCKLHIGVPILREENDDFREKYDAVVKPLSYEHKLALMMEPLDFPVTRLMTTKQKTHYLDSVVHHFIEKGVVLTMPEDRAA